MFNILNEVEAFTSLTETVEMYRQKREEETNKQRKRRGEKKM
jgi:hypothetical protein